MQALPRCRSLLITRNSLNLSSTQFASLHSTPFYNDKNKKKSEPDFKRGQQPSKNYARLVTRQKRADAKKALWGIHSRHGDSGPSFQKAEQIVYGPGSWDADIGEKSKNSSNKGRSKSASHQKIRNHRTRRKFRKGYLSESDDDHPEPHFQASFGNKWYSWSWGGTSQRTTSGFDWRDHHRNYYQKEWNTANEPDSEDEAFNLGSRSDRAVLGLPQSGPLKLKDVKNAFHLSALKWHPDKHQGPSQAAAEEKFKLCANAYKSLCSALSRA